MMPPPRDTTGEKLSQAATRGARPAEQANIAGWYPGEDHSRQFKARGREQSAAGNES